MVATRAIEKLKLITPRDDLLRDWGAKRMVGFPEKEKMAASRFLYEANLGAAFHAGQAIVNGVDPLAKDVLGNPHDDEKAGVVRRYIEALADKTLELEAGPNGHLEGKEADQGPTEVEFI